MITATNQKATKKHTKSHNKRLILKTIYDQVEISRASIARLTHLTRPTVSSTVAELIDDGLVAEVGQGPSEGGKPPTLLRVVDDSRHLIGIDLANREFQGGIFDLRGKLQQRVTLPANEQTGPAALALVYDLLDQLLSLTSRPVLGIGVGTPGLIDMQRGVIRTAVNLGWQNLALRDQLASRYQLPVHLANDSQMAALAEYTFGQSQMEANLIVIKVGRGISAGIILNGQLYRGGTAGASEIGHVRVVEGGERCLCGHFGCLETVASSQALVRQAKGDPSLNLTQVATSPQPLTTDTVLAAFQNGDESIRQIILGVGHYLGIAVANLVGALNIQHIIIGGSLARFGETLLEAIRAEMRERVLPLIAAETRVELSSLGQNLVIIGAAALLLSRELEVV